MLALQMYNYTYQFVVMLKKAQTQHKKSAKMSKETVKLNGPFRDKTPKLVNWGIIGKGQMCKSQKNFKIKSESYSYKVHKFL